MQQRYAAPNPALGCAWIAAVLLMPIILRHEGRPSRNVPHADYLWQEPRLPLAVPSFAR